MKTGKKEEIDDLFTLIKAFVVTAMIEGVPLPRRSDDFHRLFHQMKQDSLAPKCLREIGFSENGHNQWTSKAIDFQLDTFATTGCMAWSADRGCDRYIVGKVWKIWEEDLEVFLKKHNLFLLEMVEKLKQLNEQ